MKPHFAGILLLFQLVFATAYSEDLRFSPKVSGQPGDLQNIKMLT